MIFTHKINQEEFNKLKILDRIEFRQRKEDIERNFDTDLGSWNFLWKMFMIIGFIILLSISIYNISPTATISILGTIPIIIRLSIFFFILLKVIEIILTFKKHEMIKTLNEEYFKIEIKTKTKNEK